MKLWFFLRKNEKFAPFVSTYHMDKNIVELAQNEQPAILLKK
jgi:hypothetical protein